MGAAFVTALDPDGCGWTCTQTRHDLGFASTIEHTYYIVVDIRTRHHGRSGVDPASAGRDELTPSGAPITSPGSGSDFTERWAHLLVAGMSQSAKATAMADALQFRQVAELARVRRGQAVDESADARSARRAYWADAESVERAIADEVGAALHLSALAAGRHIWLAEALVKGAPATLAALGAGTIDTARATRIAEGVCLLSGETAARAEAEVLLQAADQTPAQVAASVRRAVISADPAAADRAYRRARKARYAHCRAEDDGMASIWVSGTADRITRAWQTASAVAEHRRQAALANRCAAEADGTAGADVPTLDQARSDAILDLMSSPNGLGHVPDITRPSDVGVADATGWDLPEVDVMINVVVPIDALEGRTGARPAEMAGHGPVPAAFVADLIASAGASARSGASEGGGDGVRFKRWLADPAGVVVATSGKVFPTYRPPPALDATVRARDLTCRFPGCRTPARRCDLDHGVAYPVGATAAGNLACLCRRHHRLKTHNRWKVRQLTGAVLEWTSPTGHTYRTRPPEWVTAAPARPQPSRPAAAGPVDATAKDTAAVGAAAEAGAAAMPAPAMGGTLVGRAGDAMSPEDDPPPF